MSPISNASRLADFGTGIGTAGAIIQVDNLNQRVGIGTTNPQATLQVGTGITIYADAGIISATTYSGNWGGAFNGTTATFSGAVNLDATTDSTSSSTGALIVDGGVGIAKNVYIGAGLSVAGTLTYEDVTNVDSVGLITAKSGVNVSGGQFLVGSGVTIGSAGVATFSGTADIHLRDSVKLNIGDSSDIAIYHNGSNSYIEETGTGVFGIASSELQITNASSNKVGAKFVQNAQVEIYYDNSKKFETTHTGAVVTGILTASSDIKTTANIYGAQGHFTDHIYIADTIVHTGDTNTKIRFPTNDTISFETAGSEALRVNSDGELLVNHGSSDGGGKIQAFADNQDGVDILSYSTTNTHGGRLTFYRSKNATVGSNTEVADGDSLGRIDWRGYNDDGTAYNQGARIEAFVSGDVDSSTDMPTDLVFKTSANGSSTPAEHLRITSGGSLGIGITNPASNTNLHIKDTTVSQVKIEATDNTSYGLLKFIEGDHDGTKDKYIIAYNDSHTAQADEFSFKNQIGDITLITGGTSTNEERLRITSDGEILQGISTARGNFANNTSGVDYIRQIEGTSATSSTLSLVRNSADANDGGIVIGKTRHATVLGNTAVQSGDDLGTITWAGSDGTSLQFGAEITSKVVVVSNDVLATDLIFYTNAGGTSTTERLRIGSTGISTFSTTPHDDKGSLRSIPNNNQSSSYTVVASDAGKCVTTDANVTINSSVLSVGDAVSFINKSSSDISIIQGSGLTLYNTSDASTGNKTLSGRGMATIWVASSTVAYISGNI